MARDEVWAGDMDGDRDRALYEALKEVDFSGPLWERVAERCGAYVLAKFRPSVRSGRAWLNGQERGLFGFDRDRPVIDDDGASEVAHEVFIRALPKFRESLRKGEWDPGRGAGLDSWFHTQCLFQLPNAYRAYLRQHRELPRLPLETEASWDPRDNPAVQVEITLEVEHRIGKITNDQVRHMFRLKGAGYTVREIAERLGVSVKSVENALRRNRQSRDDW